MRKSVLGATVVALLGGTALVSAQQGPPPGGGGQPSMKEQGPGQGGAEKGDAKGKGGEGSDKGSAGMKGDSDRQGPARAEKSDREDRKGTAQSDDDRKAKRAEPKDKAGDRGKTAQPSDTDRDRTKGKTAEPKDRDADRTKSKTAEPKDKAGDRQKDRAEGRDQPGSKQRDQAQTKDGQRDGARVTLTQDQRTRVHQTLSSHREARVTNVNFSINVGTRVPRSVRVHVLPADIMTIVPAYRGYRYFIVEERICIVEPRTLEIVEIIDTSGGPARGHPVTASLNLSPQQIAFILERVPADRARADVRVNLALGAEVPSAVELYEFPSDIVVEVPAVRPYRYVVVDREVVIIDPANRGVIHVLKR